MKVVLQRVRRGRVEVNGESVAEIEKGLVLLVGVGKLDTEADARWLAEKCAGLRVFADEQGKTNLSVQEVGGKAIVVSQFTLYADTRKGRRPSFIKAALPDVAEPLVQLFADHLSNQGVPTQMGVFGTEMLVEIENDGPMTVILDHGDPQ